MGDDLEKIAIDMLRQQFPLQGAESVLPVARG